MPYVYQTTFDIDAKDIDQLQIGRSLQLSIAYLKAFVTNEPGFINSRAMYSILHEKLVHVEFESSWEDWASLEAHRDQSPYAEAKMLHRFELGLTPKNIVDHVFEEIA